MKRGPASRRVVDGGDAFRATIEDAPRDAQPEMRRLYDWVVRLEQEKLAKLLTTFGSSNVTLGALLPGGVSRLVTITKYPYDTCISLSLSVLRRLAPNSTLRIEELRDSVPERRGASNIWYPSTDILDALYEAYREANGLLVDDAAAE